MAFADATEHFWSKVEMADGGCWLWIGGVSAAGYGQMRVGGRSGPTVYAHRFSYELHVGRIPDGLVIDHVCHSQDGLCLGGSSCIHRRCVNPAHLEAVTDAENKRRMPRAICVQGHPYTPENTYVYPNGARRCRTCQHDRYIRNKEGA